jgi:mitochondrial fission protein ELM1
MAQFVKHPDQNENEIYLGLLIIADYMMLCYDSTRTGEFTKSISGSSAKPVFVDRKEYEKSPHPDFMERSYHEIYIEPDYVEAVAA